MAEFLARDASPRGLRVLAPAVQRDDVEELRIAEADPDAGVILVRDGVYAKFRDKLLDGTGFASPRDVLQRLGQDRGASPDRNLKGVVIGGFIGGLDKGFGRFAQGQVKRFQPVDGMCLRD